MQAGNGGPSELAKASGKAGFFLFLYLEVLDAAFSFDGVIGAFAITTDPILIALGLGLIGAMFVRSLTVFLVRKGTLNDYVYLEHGAHWAIGALAAILLVGIGYHVNEVVTGLIGVAFIGAAFLSSILRNRRLAAEGGDVHGRPPRNWRPTATTTGLISHVRAPPLPHSANGEYRVSVNLTKGQKVSLAKRGGGSLSLVRMGLGWDAVKKRGLFGSRSQSIDLDASALLFDAGGNLVDAVWFQQLRSRDGSVQHTGDNLTGAGEGDDESVIVDLTRLSPAVTQIVFTVNSFTGQDFSQIENAFCRLVDETTNEELARYELSGSGRHNAQIMAKVSRGGGGSGR